MVGLSGVSSLQSQGVGLLARLTALKNFGWTDADKVRGLHTTSPGLCRKGVHCGHESYRYGRR